MSARGVLYIEYYVDKKGQRRESTLMHDLKTITVSHTQEGQYHHGFQYLLPLREGETEPREITIFFNIDGIEVYTRGFRDQADAAQSVDIFHSMRK